MRETCRVFGPRFVGDPVDVITGEVRDIAIDFRIDGRRPFAWDRYYQSLRAAYDDHGVGVGHRHGLDWTVRVCLDGFKLETPQDPVRFPHLWSDGASAIADGWRLIRQDARRVELHRAGQPIREFTRLGPDDPDYRLSTLIHHDGGQTRLQYSGRAAGQLEHVSDSQGWSLYCEWDDGLLRAVHAHGHFGAFTPIRYQYDARRCLVAGRDAYKHSFTWAYDPRGRVVRRRDRRGYAFVYRYDRTGRCTRAAGEDDVDAVRLAYDLSDCVTTVVHEANDATWSYRFDLDGQLQEIIDPFGARRGFLYDRAGRMRAQVDPAGGTWKVLRNAHGATTGLRDPLGYVHPTQEDPSDPRFNPLLGGVPGSILEQEHGDFQTREFDVPSRERLGTRLSALVASGLIGVESIGTERTLRDAQGLLIGKEKVLGDGRRMRRTCVYDPCGNLQKLRDYDGAQWSHTYASWNQRVSSEAPGGGVTHFVYSKRDKLLQVRDPGGSLTEYAWDLRDRLVEVRRNGRVRERYVRDLAGGLVEKRDASDEVLVRYERGPLGTLLRRQCKGVDEQFKRDARGRILVATRTTAQGSNTVERAYDNVGRQSKDVRDGAGVWHRDGGSTVAVRPDADASLFATAYRQVSGDAIEITDPTGGIHRIERLLPGVIERRFAGGMVDTSQFDPSGRCLARVTTGPGGIWQRQFIYGATGDLLAREDNRRGCTRFRYDRARRLSEIEHASGCREEYRHDAAGNVVHKPGLAEAWTPGEETGARGGGCGERVAPEVLGEARNVRVCGNRLLRANGDALTYDALDHLVGRDGFNGHTSYVRDAIGRLREIHFGPPREMPACVWRAEYDALGRRIRKHWIGNEGTWLSQEYVWDGDRLAAEVLPDGTLRLYVYADARAWVPLLAIAYDDVHADPRTGEVFTLHADHRGAVEEVQDVQGKVIWAAQIGPYGEARVSTGEGFHQPFRLVGQLFDPETGLCAHRFRMWSPEFGRFLESDPMGLAGWINVYGWPGCPLMRSDPLGLGCPGATGGGAERVEDAGADEEREFRGRGDGGDGGDERPPSPGVDDRNGPGERESNVRHQECNDPGEPISVVTGEVYNRFTDAVIDPASGWRWGRFYRSGWSEDVGPMGRGFRHSYQKSLILDPNQATFVDYDGTVIAFEREGEAYDGVALGYRLRQLGPLDFAVHTPRAASEYRFRRPRVQDGSTFLVEVRRAGAPAVSLEYDDRARLIRLTRDTTPTAPTGTVSLMSSVHSAATAPPPGDAALEVRLHYDARNHVIAIERCGRGVTSALLCRYTYDEHECLVGFRGARGSDYRYHYAEHRMIRGQDARGYGFTWTYDARGRCVASRGDDDLLAVTLDYRPGKTVVTEADGGVWVYLYNEQGIITDVTDPGGGTKEYLLDDAGHICAQIDTTGQRTEWLYDDDGHHYGRRDPWGNLVAPEDEDPHPKSGRELQIPESPQAMQLGSAGAPWASWSAWRSREAGLDTVAIPAGVRDTLEAVLYLARRQPAPSETHYDLAGAVIFERDAWGDEERHEYSPFGEAIATTDADGRTTRREYASWNLAICSTDPNGLTKRYAYDHRRLVVGIVDPGGHTVLYPRDRCGRVERVINGGILDERYVRDHGGRVVQTLDGAGNLLVEYAYGGNGLCKRRIQASGEVHVYDHDPAGNICEASRGETEVRLDYDARRRVVRDVRGGRGVEHRRDADGSSTTKLFDWLQTEASLGTGGAGSTRIVTADGGEHLFRVLPGGCVERQHDNGLHELSHFDGKGRCTGRVLWRDEHGDAPLWYARYHYSGAGELREIEDPLRGSTSLEYDAGHRLVRLRRERAEVSRYRYDAAGNLIENRDFAWLQYNARNQLVAGPIDAFEYDARKNLAMHRRAGVVTRYHYNRIGRLVRVCWDDGRPDWFATYDGFGRRIHKEQGGRRTEFYWDDHRLAAEIGPGETVRAYVYPTPDALVPIMFIDYDRVDADPRSGRAYYVVGDQLGTPSHIYDQAANIVWFARRIDPYGAIDVDPQSTISYAPRFPGHYCDEELGLHYNRFRYYSPQLGRYLQSDPLGQAGGVNLYAYPANPVARVDVFGLSDHNGVHPGGGGANPNPAGADSQNSGNGPGSDASSAAERAVEPGGPLLCAADEVFEQAVMTGPETVAGFRIFGNKGLVGDTFQRNVILLEAEAKGVAPLRGLANALEAEARTAGASQLRIVGYAVINRGFTPAVATRFGFEFRQINAGTIELTKALR